MFVPFNRLGNAFINLNYRFQIFLYVRYLKWKLEVASKLGRNKKRTKIVFNIQD